MNKVIYAVGVAVVSTLISNAAVDTSSKHDQKEITKIEHTKEMPNIVESDSIKVNL